MSCLLFLVCMPCAWEAPVGIGKGTSSALLVEGLTVEYNEANQGSASAPVLRPFGL